MSNFSYQMAATFQMRPETHQQALELAQNMAALEAGTGGKSNFSFDVDDKTSVLTLTLQSETEEAQQKALMVYGPELGKLVDFAPRLSMKCSDNAPHALKAMLAPMSPKFITSL